MGKTSSKLDVIGKGCQLAQDQENGALGEAQTLPCIIE
jgi:hypothetical protein